MIKILLIFISFVYFLRINSVTIYQCSNSELLSEQCMSNWTDKNGNIHISLKKCPDNKICQPIKDYSMGFCMANLKYLYPGDACGYFTQCTSRYCGNICYGDKENHYCNPKIKHCDQNLSCRKQIEEGNMTVYKCLNLSNINEECEKNDDCELNLVCAWKKDLRDNINQETLEINDIKNYLSNDEYLNIIKNKTCINRASLKNGMISSEEMSCESGELIEIEIIPGIKESLCGSKNKIVKDCDINNKCIVEADFGFLGKMNIEEKCVSSNLGNLICPLKEKENAWKNYLNKYKIIFEKQDVNKMREDKEIHIPYDKEKLKSNELSEAFWEYYDWIHNLEADECAKQYFFINSKSNLIKYPIYLLVINILFLF